MLCNTVLGAGSCFRSYVGQRMVVPLVCPRRFVIAVFIGESITVTFVYAAGPDKKLYGSVTTKDIAEALAKTYKIDIDKRKITLNENIKSFGNFTADVKLYSDVTGKINILVKGKDN